MNADAIAKRLAKGPDAEGIVGLIRESGNRRIEIAARGATIADAPEPSTPAARRQAVLKGPDAVRAMDDELKNLVRELAYLDRLELALNDAHEAAVNDQVRQAIPGARGELSGRLIAARSKLKALDQALAELRVVVEMLGQFERAGIKFPLTDRELSETLQFRAELWAPRTAATLIPAGDVEELRKEYPESFALMYRARGPYDFEPTRPPTFMSALDYTVESPMRYGRRVG